VCGERLVKIFQDNFLRFAVGNGGDIGAGVGNALEVLVVLQDESGRLTGGLQGGLQFTFVWHQDYPRTNKDPCLELGAGGTRGWRSGLVYHPAPVRKPLSAVVKRPPPSH